MRKGRICSSAGIPMETTEARAEIQCMDERYFMVSKETTSAPVEISLWLCDGYI